MTDIKNKIEEEARKYAEAYGRNIVPIHNDLSVYYTDCYEAGARLILEKWKDASRWRKVSDELPESDQLVLVKMDFGEGYFYDIGRYDFNDKIFYSEAFVSDSMWNSLDDVIEWKSI